MAHNNSRIPVFARISSSSSVEGLDQENDASAEAALGGEGTTRQRTTLRGASSAASIPSEASLGESLSSTTISKRSSTRVSISHPAAQYYVHRRDEDGDPVEVTIADPDSKTDPPCKLVATVGFENIDIQQINNLRLMSDGRTDYRIKFTPALLTKAELSYINRSTYYRIYKQSTKSLNMPGTEDYTEDPKRYLVRFENEWISYADLDAHYPRALWMVEGAADTWAITKQKDFTKMHKCVSLIPGNDCLTAWSPFAALKKPEGSRI